jgi:phosphate starvation-inducible membrane PsiE
VVLVPLVVLAEVLAEVLLVVALVLEVLLVAAVVLVVQAAMVKKTSNEVDSLWCYARI